MNEHIELSMSIRVVRDDPRQSSSRSRNREKLPKNLRRALVFQKMPCFFVAAPLLENISENDYVRCKLQELFGK